MATGRVIRGIGSGGGGGTTSPLTTLGDIWTYSTADDRLPSGSNFDVLTVDGTEPTGLKWVQNAGSVQVQFYAEGSSNQANPAVPYAVNGFQFVNSMSNRIWGEFIVPHDLMIGTQMYFYATGYALNSVGNRTFSLFSWYKPAGDGTTPDPYNNFDSQVISNPSFNAWRLQVFFVTDGSGQIGGQTLTPGSLIKLHLQMTGGDDFFMANTGSVKYTRGV